MLSSNLLNYFLYCLFLMHWSMRVKYLIIVFRLLVLGNCMQVVNLFSHFFLFDDGMSLLIIFSFDWLLFMLNMRRSLLVMFGLMFLFRRGFESRSRSFILSDWDFRLNNCFFRRRFKNNRFFVVFLDLRHFIDLCRQRCRFQ